MLGIREVTHRSNHLHAIDPLGKRLQRRRLPFDMLHLRYLRRMLRLLGRVIADVGLVAHLVQLRLVYECELVLDFGGEDVGVGLLGLWAM